MPAAKPALQEEPCAPDAVASHAGVATLSAPAPHLLTRPPSARPELHSVAPPAQPRKMSSFQPRVPVITGEATYRGTIAVEGTICGQLGAAASRLTIKQRPGSRSSAPELDGELSFKDLLRINGHV